MSNTITAVIEGKQRIIAVWPHERAGEFADVYAIASGAAQRVEHLALTINRIVNDDRLSPMAKEEDRKAAGVEPLRVLASLAQRLEEIKKEHHKQAAQLAAVEPYRNGDTATPLIDLEIARFLREQDDARRVPLLLLGEAPRMTEAAIRLPAQLSGLSNEAHNRITKAAIERARPAEAAHMAERGEAIEHAAEAIATAFKIISKATGAKAVNEEAEAA